MSCCLRLVVLFVLLAPLLAFSFDKKPYGEVANPDVLRRVQSYCIETSKLEIAEAADVKKFIEREERPKGVLGKLAWKRLEDCAQADAVISLRFEHSVKVSQATGGGTLQGTPMTSVPEAAFSAKMLVTDRVSAKPIYQVMGEPVAMRRDNSIGSPFSKLAHDLKVLSK